MSFDFKGPDFNKPMIQEAQNMRNNGGGGNLGYFRRKDSEEQKKQREEYDVFNSEEDKFESQLNEDNEKIDFSSIKNFFESIIKKIKGFFVKKSNPFN